MDNVSQHAQWLDLHREEIIDPAREIVDPHHHLWRYSSLDPYLLEDFRNDTRTGHNITKTVFIECGADYRREGPESMRPVGETEFVTAIAKQSELDGGPVIAGIVGHADLRLPELEEVLAAHVAAGEGRFKGIRHALSRAPEGVSLAIPGGAPENLYKDSEFQSGVRLLGDSDLSYDSWHYHFQNTEFLALAKAVPNTVMVLDHFGTPLGVGPYAGARRDIFQQWQQDIVALSHCGNVVAKLGGLSMPDNGFGWMGRDMPPSSDELVEAQGDYYHHMIDCFGPDRCMFESNFPVDKLSISYPVLWNGLKKIAARYTEAEQQAMFSGTATAVYRLD